MPSEHDEEALFHAWNHAQERRRPLLIVADAPPPAWEVALPDLRSRLAATPHVRDRRPDDALIGQLIDKLLGDRGHRRAARAGPLSGAADRTQLCRRPCASVDALDRADALRISAGMTVPLARARARRGADVIERVAERRLRWTMDHAAKPPTDRRCRADDALGRRIAPRALFQPRAVLARLQPARAGGGVQPGPSACSSGCASCPSRATISTNSSWSASPASRASSCRRSRSARPTA